MLGKAIVDSHVHVWSDGDAFASPDHSGASPHRADASVSRLLEAMGGEGVAAAVLVQYIGYRWDNDYVARAIKDRPDIFAGICRVDPDDPTAPDRLSALVEEEHFQGVRLNLASDARGNWLNGPVATPLLRRAAALKVPVLFLTEPGRLQDLARILDQNPDLDVVIDHMADCDPSSPDHMGSLGRLSENPRVFLKTGHLWVHSAQGYPWKDQHALVKLVCDMFGPSRIMWGSDWSFSLAHATYHQALGFLQDASFLTDADKYWIFGATARRLWRFAEPAMRPVERQDATSSPATGG